VHDTVDLEGRGIPTVFVATERFVDGAQAQAKSLGSDPVGVFVAHPIQDRTDDEVERLAADAVERIVAGLVEGRAPVP
jgi:hypothetical protein